MKLSRPPRGSNGTGASAEEVGPTPTSSPTADLRAGVEGLRDLMDRLLAPDGCPWDREQTLDSLRPYLLEEAHEVLDAMDDPEHHRQELGDLLFQIVFHAALREREGAFDLDAVVEGIRTKMIRRHPHVFAAPGERPEVTDAEDVTRQWEAIKRAERGETGPRNPIQGVPRGLPALQRAWRLQEKAAAVGFDWPDVDGAIEKLREEWQEFQDARGSGDIDAMREEFGDLLFVLVRVGQKLGLDAEDALRRANGKFERRFAHVMARAHEHEIDPANAGLEQLDAWWDEAKLRER